MQKTLTTDIRVWIIGDQVLTPSYITSIGNILFQLDVILRPIMFWWFGLETLKTSEILTVLEQQT